MIIQKIDGEPIVKIIDSRDEETVIHSFQFGGDDADQRATDIATKMQASLEFRLEEEEE